VTPLRSVCGAAAFLLCVSAAVATRPPAIDSFPGIVQPDPGTRAAVARNGRAVAFEASVRDAGARWDPAADPTVLLWRRREGSLSQLTAASCDQPAVEIGEFYFRVGNAAEKEHRSRTLVAFRSSANLTGANGDLSPEIFVWDSGTGGITQVSDSLDGESGNPAIGASFHGVQDAKGLWTGAITVRWRVAFLSTADLTGDNPLGLPQVFVYDSALPEVERLVQVSHGTTGAAGPPAVDARGRRVAFVHDGDLLPGAEPPGSPAVYTWDLRRGLRRAAGGGVDGQDAAEPCLDSSGRWVAWSARGDLTGLRGVMVSPAGGGTPRHLGPAVGEHRAPALGRGRGRIVALSTEAEGTPGVVAERPVLLRRSGVKDLGIPGGGAFGAPALQRDRRLLFFTGDGDLDGTNASGRDVLWLVNFRR